VLVVGEQLIQSVLVKFLGAIALAIKIASVCVFESGREIIGISIMHPLEKPPVVVPELYARRVKRK
jgi:hypothetical protein